MLLEFSATHEKATWKGIKLNSGGRSATICCPGCGKLGSLLDFAIGDDGVVTPSITCPDEKCGFHENVVLNGWSLPRNENEDGQQFGGAMVVT